MTTSITVKSSPEDGGAVPMITGTKWVFVSFTGTAPYFERSNGKPYAEWDRRPATEAETACARAACAAYFAGGCKQITYEQ